MRHPSFPRLPHLILLLHLFGCLLTGARAQTTAFTYQGQLNDGLGPANGSYDLRLGRWSAASGPAPVGSTLTTNAVAVANGAFIVTIDFGHQFPGADRWLEIAVRTNGSGAFATLAPRQIIPTTPYAIHSATAGSVAAGNLTGTLPAASIGAGTTITSVMLASGTVGSNHLASGTVTPAKLSANVPQLDHVNAFVSGTNSFAGRVGIGTTTPGEDLAIQTNTGDTNAPGKLNLAAHGGRKRIMQSVSGLDTNSTGGGNVDVSAEVTCTALNLTSDRNAGEQFKSVNAREVLDKVVRVSISEWQYMDQHSEWGDESHDCPRDLPEAVLPTAKSLIPSGAIAPPRCCRG